MMGIDLLRQDKKWKEALMDIRHLMADLVQKVYYFFTGFVKIVNLS